VLGKRSAAPNLLAHISGTAERLQFRGCTTYPGVLVNSYLYLYERQYDKTDDECQVVMLQECNTM